MTVTTEPLTEASPIAAFFTPEGVSDVQSELEAVLADINNATGEDAQAEGAAALEAIKAGIEAGKKAIELSRLQREVAQEEAALVVAQNNLLAKKKRLAELVGRPEKKPRAKRRTKEEKAADEAAAAAATATT